MNTPDQSKIATQALLRRAAELRIDISRELEKRDEEHFSDLAGAITDRGEEAVADLLVDINLAEISRDVEELREVEAALKRLSVGTYGRCIDCGKDIGQKRLNAVPAASRCFDCQTNFEHADRREHHRSL